MKRYFFLLLSVLILSACGSDNLEHQEQAVKNNEESSFEEVEIKEESSTVSNDVNEESTDTEKSKQNTEQMIKQFIGDMYTEHSLENYSNLDDIVSEDFKEQIRNQFSDIVNEEDLPDTEIGTKNVEIFKSTSNRDEDYIYVLDLEVIDHDTENISKSQHIGKIKMIKESNTLRIDDVEELSNKEIDG